MTKVIRYSVIAILGIALICIRLFETQLFYDPYIEFFKSDYLYLDSPKVNVTPLFAFVGLRFLLNTMLSLGIIFLVFKDKRLVKLSVIIFALVFILVSIPFTYLILHPNQEYYYVLFNLRRFLIQPIVLLLLLPAFYYFKLKR